MNTLVVLGMNGMEWKWKKGGKIEYQG